MNRKESPELSVIVPVYNTGDFIRQALESILSQDFSNLEIIAINDGSTDDSSKLLEEYGRKESRIQVYHRTNSGLSATRNFGLRKASGSYIYFFDSDDRMVPNSLGKLMEMIRSSKSDMIGFSGRNIDVNGDKMAERRAFLKLDLSNPVNGEEVLVEMMRKGCYSPIVSMYIYSSVFLKKNRFSFSEGYIHEDEYFTMRALCMARKVLSVPEVLFEHRVREGSIMANSNSLVSAEGWAKAVTEMLTFLRNHEVQPQTRKAILTRARQLAHNTVKIIQNENTRQVHLSDFYSDSELDQLGFHLRLRNHSPALFKIYNKIRHLVSLN